MIANDQCPRCSSRLGRRLGGLCLNCVSRRLMGMDLASPEPFSPQFTDEAVGSTIGHFKLVRKLGEGGCGVVYAADQEAPLRRQVALKIIKPGMDSKAIVARLAAERQALALMDHPHIAKVFDGGESETGRSYFVMELVAGRRITEYCDQHRLVYTARLELFILVCQAMQHAHQKGIIHRDLKPSNILVAVENDQPVPKVIDFGIAKATGVRLTDATLATGLSQLLGTPAYMSPEQAEFSGRDVDARSDIYSLGVLLYELLTGSTPFDTGALLEAGLDGLRHTLREVEPPRPSVRLGARSGMELENVAKARGTSVRELLLALRGDLDWIVMKCLEKDPTRRYASSNALAMDLQRHLADEPVTARAPGAGYLFWKFARRHKTALAAILVSFFVLLTATTLSTWEAIRAVRAESLARQRLVESEQARADAEALSTFLTEAFQSPDPAHDGRSVTVAETLTHAAQRIDTELAGQPGRRARLQAALGRTFLALGLFREAIAIQEKVRDYDLANYGMHSTNMLQAMQALAISCDKAGNSKNAISLRQDFLKEDQSGNAAGQFATLQVMISLADNYRQDHLWREELKLRERILSLSGEVLGPVHPDTLEAMHQLASAQAMLPVERRSLLEKLLPLCRQVYGPENRKTVEVLSDLANATQADGPSRQARQLRKELVDLSTRALGPTAPLTQAARDRLQQYYRFNPDYDDPYAETFLTGALAAARQVGTNHARKLILCLWDLADFRQGQQRFAEGEQLFLEARQLGREPETDSNSLLSLNLEWAYGLLLAEWGWSVRVTNPALAYELAVRGIHLIQPVTDAADHDSRSAARRVASLKSVWAESRMIVAFTDPAITPTAREEELKEVEALLLGAARQLAEPRQTQSGWHGNYRDTLQRLVQLYALWPKPELYNQWHQTLAAFTGEADKAGQ